MECKFDTFYMQSINCYILELSQCIKACIIYKLLLLYYYTPFPHPCPTIHSRFSTTHSSTPLEIDNIYHPLTMIITTNSLCHSLPSIPILPQEGRLPAAPYRSSQAPTPFHAEKSIKLPMLEVSSS